ncbi:pyridoxal phosphate-dependent aminotransferase [Paraburkholderia antibiotica]|uniref:Histidinol-phosphate aminotransferase n=1 Tax=Paraburkholderia antibiotica TaxID=2728839 RepID=A0A7Y0FFG4_9BURK|nr:histidinol-phosphate transaminase [Paraburkholderia antibiotica]NML34187.1 aminotransferase class I/II-fold pyridoxal phosphate-dependent enzyme [Paraburkholderia antibiotica]
MNGPHFDHRHPDEHAVGSPLPMPYLVDGPVYTPGQASAPAGAATVFRLASNESPLGMSDMARDAIFGVAGNQHLYPDPDGAPLARAIGDVFGLDPARIVTSPGSDIIINWIIQGWVGQGSVIYPEHAFQSYRIRAANNGATPVAAPEVDLRTDVQAILRCVSPQTRAVFIANPNNPTGTWLSLEELRSLRARLRSDILLVVDEAYFDYVRVRGYETALALVDSPAANVIVTRTFSKFYGLAGLRVGWAYVPTSFVRVFDKLRGPFAVSRIAIAAAIASLGDTAYQTSAYTHNVRWRTWLQDQIRGLGYRTTDSVGNFALFQVPGGADGATTLNARLAAKGLLCRVANQNALPEWIRVSVGSADAMTAFVQALSDLSRDARHR